MPPAGEQVIWGKAFEYACLMAIYNALKDNQEVVIEDTPQFRTAEKFFQEEFIDTENLNKAANGAVKMLMRLEPQLVYPADNKPLYLSLQPDSAGKAGDVRDVLCIRKQNEWEIGISCKHNHEAVKHSRLSNTIDFGSKWFDIPCHTSYFDRIRPIFDELARMRAESNTTAKWEDLPDKVNDFYKPILDAFLEEINLLYTENGAIIPERLIKYLIGRNDFYKVITNDRRRYVRIEAINLYGTLNRKAEGNRPINDVPRLALPSRFYFIGYEDNKDDTIKVACDKGWEISFRIHNAKKTIEPSVKFDVELISMPASIVSYTEPY